VALFERRTALAGPALQSQARQGPRIQKSKNTKIKKYKNQKIQKSKNKIK